MGVALQKAQQLAEGLAQLSENTRGTIGDVAMQYVLPETGVVLWTINVVAWICVGVMILLLISAIFLLIYCISAEIDKRILVTISIIYVVIGAAIVGAFVMLLSIVAGVKDTIEFAMLDWKKNKGIPYDKKLWEFYNSSKART